MKNILLKFDDKKFFKLKNVKIRYELQKQKELTWEEFILEMRKVFEWYN